jgi:hypothetical protein
LCDEAGNGVYSADNEVACEVTGPVKIIGMEDANSRNTEDYKDNRQKAYHGKVVVYVQSLGEPGKASVKFSSQGIKATVVEFDVD